MTNDTQCLCAAGWYLWLTQHFSSSGISLSLSELLSDSGTGISYSPDGPGLGLVSTFFLFLAHISCVLSFRGLLVDLTVCW